MAGTVVRRLMRCGRSAYRDASHRWRSLLRLLLLLLLLFRRTALCWSRYEVAFAKLLACPHAQDTRRLPPSEWRFAASNLRTLRNKSDARDAILVARPSPSPRL